MKIVIAGASGFIGQHLVSFFEQKGAKLILLSRHPTSSHAFYWNPEKQEIEASLLEGSDLVINLSGENILGRWSEKKMEHIRQSRLDAAEFLCDTLLQLQQPPKLYINASAVGYYGDRGEDILTEEEPPGQDFLSKVCVDWEKIPNEKLVPRNIRVVLTRFGIVLGKNGGALKHIDKAFSMGMGGILGSGKQFMSWIAIDDLISAMQHVIDHPELSGAINFTAPNPVTNQEFTKHIGQILHRPTAISVPKFALNMLFGSGAEMFLSSIRAVPKRLLDSGYNFQFPEIKTALKKYLHTNS